MEIFHLKEGYLETEALGFDSLRDCVLQMWPTLLRKCESNVGVVLEAM